MHLHHPDGKAVIDLAGRVNNRGVPADAIAVAVAWVIAHEATLRAEWQRLDNPEQR